MSKNKHFQDWNNNKFILSAKESLFNTREREPFQESVVKDVLNLKIISYRYILYWLFISGKKFKRNRKYRFPFQKAKKIWKKMIQKHDKRPMTTKNLNSKRIWVQSQRMRRAIANSSLNQSSSKVLEFKISFSKPISFWVFQTD